MRRTCTKRVPGELLLSPVALCSIFVLVLNDHVLKAAFDNWITGKLSDVAGLVFFPLFLQAGLEWGLAATQDFKGHSNRVLVITTLMSAIVFSGIQLFESLGDVYRVGLGFVQWVALLGMRAEGPVVHFADPGDLIALFSLPVALRIGWQRTRTGDLAEASA